MRHVKVAATQMSCSWDKKETLMKADNLVRKAAKEGAEIILIQELFETPYFCKLQKFEYMELATTIDENPAIKHFSKVAKELEVVLPISFFEKVGNTQFNSIAIIDADGLILGTYRKTHIPDGLPYAEKFYFTPGDTGFKVWKTKYATIGVGICWDQWFPEAARSMALLGAEILLYPTAIGSEPTLGKDSSVHWRNTMAGHAAANMMPVVASNRIGREIDEEAEITFYGNSFIADNHGEIVKQADNCTESILVHEFDLDELSKERREWGIFRDRRPEMYKTILTHGE
ncbi:MAG: N-carbamoylputrescine amidase [Lachnospiraceae bacterium]|nr:N-carbamoylputrescine amidase [Lachnospiraceae bacterium]